MKLYTPAFSKVRPNDVIGGAPSSEKLHRKKSIYLNSLTSGGLDVMG